MATVPFFSIVIPSFNSGNFIEATLASIAAQTFRNFEVVVVDDGSTDDSLEKCKGCFAQFAFSGQVKQRPSEIKKGVASCRNLGVELSRGEWICFLDGDDLFMPEKLEITYAAIQAHGGTSLAYYHGVEHFENGTNNKLPLEIKQRNEFPVDILDELLLSNFITTSTVTIQKSLFLELGGFNDELHGVEDYFMWLRAAKRTQWCYANKALTGYRIMNNSLMRGRELTYYVSQSRALLACASTCNEFSAEELKSIDQYMFRNLMFFYAGNSLQRKGRKDFFNGMFALMKAGKLSLSSAIMFKHLKFACLQYAVAVYKKANPASDGVRS